MTRAMIQAGLRGVLALSLLAAAWKEHGKPVPDTAWARSDGDFGAMLVFTDKPGALYTAWEQPGPAVRMSETPNAVRGVPIVAVIFFAGCAADAHGHCQTMVHFMAQGPDGKPYGQPLHGELWVDKPPPGKGQMQLSAGNLAIVIEPKDPLGEYKVKAEITDTVTKKTMTLERTFTAVEAPKQG